MSENHKVQEEIKTERTTSAQTPKIQGWQMVKFTLFSISAGIIQVLSFTLLKLAMGEHSEYGLSYFIALVLSVIWNFTFNRRYTFRSDANIPHAMMLVGLYYLVFTPLSIWWGMALTQLGWNDFIVLAGTMVINFVSEFLFQRFVVYRDHIDTNDVAKRKLAQTEQTEE